MKRFLIRLIALGLLMVLLLSRSACHLPATGFSASSEKPAATVTPYSGFIASVDEVPPFDGNRPYVFINGSVPFFTKDELTTECYEYYAELDSLGRCGVTRACLGKELMPTEEREGIGQIKPSGWHTVKYDCVEDRYLYNRCHLIGYQLTGENANERNLITGTRYMNKQGMLPFENKVASFIRMTGKHVLYQVTPIFDGSNLLCRGVQLEAYSVEDTGKGICFNVYCYNVQPGISINYSDGDSKPGDNQPFDTPVPTDTEYEFNYVINTGTGKFHKPECSSVQDMKPQNKKEVHVSREELIAQGYSPCRACNP